MVTGSSWKEIALTRAVARQLWKLGRWKHCVGNAGGGGASCHFLLRTLLRANGSRRVIRHVARCARLPRMFLTLHPRPHFQYFVLDGFAVDVPVARGEVQQQLGRALPDQARGYQADQHQREAGPQVT